MDEVKVGKQRIPDAARSHDGCVVPLLQDPSFDPPVLFEENVSYLFVAFQL